MIDRQRCSNPAIRAAVNAKAESRRMRSKHNGGAAAVMIMPPDNSYRWCSYLGDHWECQNLPLPSQSQSTPQTKACNEARRIVTRTPSAPPAGPKGVGVQNQFRVNA